MLAVQLDHNSDAKKLARECNDGGLVECHRLPPSLRNKQDDTILTHATSLGRMLFTFDRTIAEEWWYAISGGCFGVVILALDGNDSYNRTMTFPIAAKMLGAFKIDFPQWHTLCWNHSVVEITRDYVKVNHVEPSGVVMTPNGFVDRNALNWQAHLRGLLASNASRVYPTAAGS